jgi:zinc transport system ATP-binding protein
VSGPATAAGAAREVVLEARDLALAYDGGKRVLEHVALSVRAGDFWFLLGPNGSGKTTLLHAILGLVPPAAGELRLHPALGARERIGFVPQRCDLNPALPTTVREFVLLGTVGVRATRREEAARLEWALAHAGLAGMARQSYWALSGGQRQRALVARALVRRPSVLILDEPTSHLDPGVEETLLQLLAELNREERLTILVVTHHIRAAALHATHVGLIRDRTVVAGERDRILDRATVERLFGIDMEIGGS